MKWLGIALILLGSSGIGFRMAGELEQRIRMLRGLQQALQLLKGELRCGRRTLTESLRNVSGHVDAPFSEFFSRIGEELARRDGSSAEEIWRENLDRYAGAYLMQPPERRALQRLGSVLGYLDMKAQLEALEECLGQLQLAEEEARGQAFGRRKLYRYLGMLGGMFLVILIV